MPLQNISWILFLNLYIPPWLQKSFIFMVVRLLENTLKSQRNESVHFYLGLRAKVYSRFLSYNCFWKSIILGRKGKDYGAEKMTKIKLVKVLVTSFDEFHIFPTFTYLVPVLFCQNLDSSILKCWNYLT